MEVARRFREEGPEMLQVLNIDNTYRPENWYMYGQLPDVAFADPYYQEQLKSVYQMDPGRLGAYVKPTYVYAAGTIYQSACAPKPMHLILHSCSFAGQDDPFRPPTPEEKRVELYYSIAAGARGISFWWYTSGGGYNGMGSDTPSMRRLFAECALVGAELRSAEPLLSRACPAPLPVQGSRMLWVRTLLAGQDSIVIVIVNDSIACDRKGTVVRPLEKAGMQLKPPAWLQSRDVFEVSSGGMKDVDWKSTDSGLSVNLGKVEVTRMIVVTSDTELRGHLQQRYDTHFAGNIVKLVDEAKVK